MKGTFRQSMTWLHTWCSLLFCWVLYFIFVTGTLGYFDNEIDRWMKPEVPPAVDVPVRDAYGVAWTFLEKNAPGAVRWSIAQPSRMNHDQLTVSWRMPEPADADAVDPESLRGNHRLHTVTGEPLSYTARETSGGQVLYRMHYNLHYIKADVAYRMVGVITLILFLAIITGIVAHKKIFKEFFTFRPKKGARSWLDMHNLLGVSSLPFLLMITYSGLVFVILMWMPGVLLGSYGFDAEKAQAGTQGLLFEAPSIERSGEPAATVNLEVVLRQVEDQWGLENLDSLQIQNPGDANSRIIAGSDRAKIYYFPSSLVFDGVTGAFIEERPFSELKSISFAAAMIGLHEGQFADTITRWLFFIAGLIGSAAIATGAVYWTAKRRKAVPEREQDRGFRFVDCLNIGTIAGLPVAIAAYFLANRLLPVEMDHRAEWEVHAMFIVWAACLFYPLFRSRVKAWRELFFAAAIACLAIPIVNAITTDAHLLASIRIDDWVLAGFDMTCLILGLGFAVLASRIGVKAEAEDLGTPKQASASVSRP
ncbi:MAG: PepSY-associated TM helix domain-containing protein [Pseudomonadota bacterium]